MQRVSLLLDLLAVALAVLVLGTVGAAWAVRVPHPYDLEWMEGGMLAHAWRLQQGLELYPSPGPDFIPFVYPPGYPAVLAALGRVFELGHPLGRALAIGSTLVAAAAIAVGVGRHGKQPLLGVVAAAVFVGTWPHSGAFFDLVRPDSMSVAFLGWAIVLGLERHRGAAVASGLLLAAAWICKHNAAAYGLPMLLGIALRDGWRRGVIFGLAAGLPALVTTLFLQLVTEGRFLAYILGVPASHPMVGARIVPGTPGELAHALPLAVLLASLAVIVLLRRRAGLSVGWTALACIVGAGLVTAAVVSIPYPSGVPSPSAWARWAAIPPLGAAIGAGLWGLGASIRARRVPWTWVYGLGIAGVALLTAGLMRGHHGGFLNVLMPLHWVVAFAAGMGAAGLRLGGGPGMAALTSLLLSGQLGVQAWTLQIDRFLPTEEDRTAGDLVVERIRHHCDGPVLSPYASWLPVQAGQAPSVHLIAVWDINHPGGPFREHMKTLRQAARDQHWACVIEGGRRPIGFEVDRHYQVRERFPIQGRALLPRTGWRVRPGELHLPR